MLAFGCPHCAKTLRVKDELAGKKGKCPACGNPITIPTASDLAAASNANRPSPVPASGPPPGEVRTSPPKPAAPSLPGEAPPIPPGPPAAGPGPAAELSHETVSGGAKHEAAGHPPELTEFLAPPQAPD